MGLVLVIVGLVLLLLGYFLIGLILIIIGICLFWAPGPVYGYGYWRDRRRPPP
jgi:hypothetical protein